MNHIVDGYRLPFFLKQDVGPQIQNDAAHVSEKAILLDYNHPAERLLREQIPHFDTILNVEDFEIEI